MAVYVDAAAVPYKGRPRHHLTADSLDELHQFTASIGIKRCWYHPSTHPHYDITDEQRADALAAGATPVSARMLVAAARLLGSRLVRPPRL